MTAARTTTGEGWFMTAPGAALERRALELPAPGPGEALVEVAGCGVCHTDLSFLHQGVKTRGALPLVLGHEISGYVRAVGQGADASLVGRAVIVPAVLPCGECDLCRAGRRAVCRNQVMPGNDRHGGYASHVAVPARFLCPVPDRLLVTHDLWELAVVSDAVSTPFQAVKKSGLAAGDFAVFVGTGGIGVHGVQIAAAAGAHVVAVDVNAGRLAQAAAAGANGTLDIAGMSTRDVRKAVRDHAARLGAPAHCWKIFETSGTKAGQETAYALLGFGAVLSVVGYTPDRIEICLSNLMAYDADARGNWGADPLVYPELLQWIADGRIAVKPYVERHPLAAINDVFDDAHHGRLTRRAVLTPA
ncbi:MAG: 6-hydroxycyclohex-1-ene-1-carbonyl-CoA dehydrogenase [Gemmatimonadota bacterium]|nr:6-hydroxycyclohex-1-ene-1-carbonyl-CoA dehydrogenase [Gemmatimonadota bacterium]MDE3173366.1 6-hydroxycyclohex-1-ene-1-carbonyl-CoA dehydrogenase [Gemmatimonadota bacterium]